MSELPQIFSLAWWEIFIGGISTLAIYSFLYKENPFYRFFEHLFIGIATGITIMATIKEFFWPLILKPLLGIDRIMFPDGAYSEPYNIYNLLYLLPMAFGLLYYAMLTKKHAWLAQLVIGFSLGIGGAMAFKGILTELIPQLTDSFRPLVDRRIQYNGNLTMTENLLSEPLITSFSNVVFVFVLITVLSYFFFTFKRRSNGMAERSATIGRWMMMGCFGAFFGATIMARMALLVERLEFLINSWWPALFGGA